MKILNFIFSFKFCLKPKQSEILVYDATSLKFAKLLFFKKNLSVYYNRYDGVYILTFLRTLFKSGIKNFIKNYKLNIFRDVSPKIIYTSIDNNLGFFKLKDLYPNATYIADQNGMRDEKFYVECKKHLKREPKKYLKTDIFFCFGDNEKKRLSKVIKGTFLPLGNTLNNFTRKNISSRKIKKIYYISSGDEKKMTVRDDLNFKNIMKFAKLHKLKLYFLDKPRYRRKSSLEKNFGKNFKYLNSKGKNFMNSITKSDSLFIFGISTLGYEILSKGFRTVSLNHNEFKHSNKQYFYKGPFWYHAPKSKYAYNPTAKIINKVLRYKQKSWVKICKKYSRELLYDNNNIKKLKLIKKFL